MGASMRAYMYIAKMHILTSFAYRFEVIAAVCSNILILCVTVFLWKTAYAGTESGSIINFNDMVTYSILSALLAILFRITVQDTMLERAIQGSIAIDFIRPISILISYLAEDIGKLFASMLCKVLPLLVCASLIFHIPKPSGEIAFIASILSCIFSFCILWILSAIFGMIAFWTMELGNLGKVKDAVVRVLSGSFVPLWFFPKEFQVVSKFLPFQYTYQTPIGIYIGVYTHKDVIISYFIQLIWIFALSILLITLWKSVSRKTLIQGG